MMKLLYFDFGGTAEAIRLAFFLGGVPFEDIRLTPSEFGARRDSLPNGKLPVLEFPSGEQIPQSAAILRYAGKINKEKEMPLLYPIDPLEALRCDALVDAVQDFNEAMRPTMAQFLPGLDHDEMLESRRILASTFIPKWLEDVSCQLNEVGPFALGSELLICDLALFCRLKWLRKGILEGIPATLVDGYPRLIRLMSSVQRVETVQEYYLKHPIEKSGWWENTNVD